MFCTREFVMMNHYPDKNGLVGIGRTRAWHLSGLGNGDHIDYIELRSFEIKKHLK
jgi:hypothetical protein